MADEAATTDKPKPVMPYGAQCLRKLRGGLKALVDEVTGMAAPMDDGPAKADLGGFVSGLSDHIGAVEKAWAKHYKDHDIDAEDAPAPEETKADKPAETTEGDDLSDEDIDAVLDALGDDPKPAEGNPEEKPTEKSDPVSSDEDDDEANMTPEEKRHLKSRIERLERALAE